MGLFSTRKPDDSIEGYTATANDNAVVRVFRSRFYGKSKGKERVSSSMSYISNDASPSQTLAGPSSHPYSPSLPSPLANGRSSMQSNAAAGPSSSRAVPKNDPAAFSPRKAKRPHPGSPDMLPPPSPKSPTNEYRQRDREKSGDDSLPKSSTPPASPPRKVTDSITVTLAQKLNELAVANSQGLLNDHDYRLLRQNLFQRFSSTAAVPAETPVVPVSKPKPQSDVPPSSPSRISSNGSQPVIPRTPSRASLSTGVANILRRATGRSPNPSSKDGSDSSSFVSERSTPSGVFKITRNVTRKLSISSVKTSTSLAPADSISVTSRLTGASSDRLRSESVTSLSPTGSKSATGSIRRFNTPPSSFRGVGLDNKSIYSGVYDDDRLQTSQEIKQEIIAVEAEAKNMMDAFNGLELTTLTKLQKKTGRNSVIGPGTNLQSTWTLIPNNQSQHMPLDNDSISIRSATSAGTSASVSRSAYSTRQIRSTKNLGSPGVLLHRKNSTSSYNSYRMGGTGQHYGHMMNSSNLSLPRSTHQHSTRAVPDDGGEKEMVMIGNEEEVEVEEIRRRREEVMMRYEARLEYLQARLKGALLHEKLVRK